MFKVTKMQNITQNHKIKFFATGIKIFKNICVVMKSGYRFKFLYRIRKYFSIITNM